MKVRTPLLALAGLTLTGPAYSQTVLHYWDFTTTTDLAGGVPTSATGTPDLSINAIYGEAYPGAGASLNTVFNDQSYLIADTHDGLSPTALDFGTDDFSFSWWSYSDSSDMEANGPRVFDCLSGTSTGLQCLISSTANVGLRIDTSDGGATIAAIVVVVPDDVWTHFAVTVNRTTQEEELFVNGVSQGTAGLAFPNNGGIFATQDLEIGVINTDGTQNQVYSGGLDDLAFYDGLLSPTDIAGLAAGTLTPADFGGPAGPDFCNGDGGDQLGCTNCPCGNNAPVGTIGGCLNQSGNSAQLVMGGSSSVTAADPMDLSFTMTGGNPATLAVLTSGDALAPQNAANPCFGTGNGVMSGVLDGLRCAVTNTQRHGGRPMDAAGDVGLTNNGWGGAAGPMPSIANQGGFVAGQTRYFQVFYRADTAQGCGTGQNTTQAIEVTFAP